MISTLKPTICLPFIKNSLLFIILLFCATDWSHSVVWNTGLNVYEHLTVRSVCFFFKKTSYSRHKFPFALVHSSRKAWSAAVGIGAHSATRALVRSGRGEGWGSSSSRFFWRCAAQGSVKDAPTSASHVSDHGAGFVHRSFVMLDPAANGMLQTSCIYSFGNSLESKPQMVVVWGIKADEIQKKNPKVYLDTEQWSLCVCDYYLWRNGGGASSCCWRWAPECLSQTTYRGGNDSRLVYRFIP